MEDENGIDDELSYKEIGLNQLEALISAVPFVGSAINTLYFGHKRDREFKRIEKLYKLISSDIDKIKDQISSMLSNNDSEATTGIIEAIHESAEKDYTESKLKYLKNCYLNTLMGQTKNTYEDRRVFIRILNELTEDDIEILTGLYQAPDGAGYSLEQFSEDQKIVVYAVFERLKSYGLAYLKLSAPITTNIDFTEISTCVISKYGIKFYDYCLNLSDH